MIEKSYIGKEIEMEEKAMVADTLDGINSELKKYADMIPQTENQELKNTLKQFRNAAEMSQENIYSLARERSYYIPAAQATEDENSHVRSLFS